MLNSLRNCRTVFSRANATHSTAFKSFVTGATAKTSPEFDDDMPVEMEDPFKPEPKRCFLCGVRVDYKNVQLLSQFVSSYTAVPVSQRMSGLCEKKYSEVLQNIKMSRRAGYMAFRTKETTFLEDADLSGMTVRRRARRVPSRLLPTEEETMEESGTESRPE